MLLRKGDNNEQVKQLQVKLHLDPVGNFGPKTEEAVKLWQSAHGLTSDGIVGDKTWAMIMGEADAPAPAQQAVVAVSNSTGLKLEKLKGHIPDAVIAMIPDTAAKFQINTPLRLAHFLAQCGHESGGFRVTSENLNYSAKGLNGISQLKQWQQLMLETHKRLQTKCMQIVWQMVRKQVEMATNSEVEDISN